MFSIRSFLLTDALGQLCECKSKKKGKVRPKTGHEGPEGE